MSSQVEPVEVITKKSITRVSVAVNSIVLFESVSLLVTLFDGENVLETRLLKFEGDDYKGWKDDDTYLLQLTLERLGFVPAPAPESVPVPESAPEPVPEQEQATAPEPAPETAPESA